MGHFLVTRITIFTTTIYLFFSLNSVFGGSVDCVNAQCLKLSKCQYAGDKIDDGEVAELIRCGDLNSDEPSYCCPTQDASSSECDFCNGDSFEVATQYCNKIGNMFKKRLIMPSGQETQIDECQLKDVPVIINGEVTKIGEFPHMALLGYVRKTNPADISWQCGGTLISDRYVLTAKHCYSQNPNDPIPSEYGDDEERRESDEDDGFEFHPVSKVLLGAHDYNSTEEKQSELYSVEKFIAYDRELESAYNDIALIRLDRKVRFSQLIYPACLNTKDSYSLVNYIITGWGEYRQYYGRSSVMLKGVVELYDDEVCVQKYSRVRSGYLDEGVNPDVHICGGTKSLKNVTQSYNYCQGDSGGPLQYYNGNCSYTVIGIVSTTIAKCNTIGFPSIFTRVYGYTDWIVNKIWKN